MIQSQTGINVSVPSRRVNIKDYLIPRGMNTEEWLSKFDEHIIRRSDELAFSLKNSDEDTHLVFTPHYKQHRERYGIYWSIFDEGSLELQQHLEQTEQERRLQEASIDTVQIGNDQYELEHQIQGEHTIGGTWEGLNGRRAKAGGWFSYQMNVQPETALVVTFSHVHSHCSMDIYVDGVLLSTEVFKNWNRKFFNRTFVLPATLIAGRDSVNVKFVPNEKENGIYGILRVATPI